MLDTYVTIKLRFLDNSSCIVLPSPIHGLVPMVEMTN